LAQIIILFPKRSNFQKILFKKKFIKLKNMFLCRKMNIESCGIFRNILVFKRGSPKLIDWSIGCLCTMEFILPGYWIRNVWVLLGTTSGTNGNFVTDSKCQWFCFWGQFCDVAIFGYDTKLP
jgi:hypothetical protein